MTLLRYRPLTFTMLDRLMDELASQSGAPTPEMTDDGYIISLALPGVPPDAIELTAEGRTLSVTVDERDDRQREDGSYRGAVAGRRTFSWLLPEGADAESIRADCEHGMLTITIPKAESARPRRISVGGSGAARQVGPGTAEVGAEPAAKGASTGT